MDILSITYLVIMALGVIWVIYRIIYYLRAERERDSVTQQMFSEEQFKAYMENAGTQVERSDNPGTPKAPGNASER